MTNEEKVRNIKFIYYCKECGYTDSKITEIRLCRSCAGTHYIKIPLYGKVKTQFDMFRAMYNEELDFNIKHIEDPSVVLIHPQVQANKIQYYITCAIVELTEALQETDWKRHKKPKNNEGLNKEKFLEEMVDCFKFFLLSLQLGEVTVGEFIAEYFRKSKIVRERQKNGY